MKGSTMLGVLVGVCLLPASVLAGDRPDDFLSLQELEEARILWDVTLDDPEALVGRLGVIEQTYEDLERQGVQPRMIFAFRGGASALVAADPEHWPEGQEEHVEALQRKLVALEQLDGVERIEACSLATGRRNLSQDKLVSPVVEVGNTFVTAAAYAQRGYANIRVD